MSKKRANGEGSVYKTKDGRVIGSWQDANGKTRYMTSQTMTKREMSKAVRKKLQDRDEGIVTHSEGLTMEQYLDRWLEAIRGNVRPGTFKPYEAMVRLFHAATDKRHINKLMRSAPPPPWPTPKRRTDHSMHKQVCPTCNGCYHTLAHTPTTMRPPPWLALPAQREEAEIQEEGQAHAEHNAHHYPEEATPTQGWTLS